MTTTVYPESGFLIPSNPASATNPHIVQGICLQEQFTGQIPARSERPMAEILAERLVRADPSRPAPVFVP